MDDARAAWKTCKDAIFTHFCGHRSFESTNRCANLGNRHLHFHPRFIEISSESNQKARQQSRARAQHPFTTRHTAHSIATRARTQTTSVRARRSKKARMQKRHKHAATSG